MAWSSKKSSLLLVKKGADVLRRDKLYGITKASQLMGTTASFYDGACHRLLGLELNELTSTGLMSEQWLTVDITLDQMKVMFADVQYNVRDGGHDDSLFGLTIALKPEITQFC